MMGRSRFNLFKNRQQAWVFVVGCLFVADFAFYGYLPAHQRLQTLQQAHLQKTRLIQTAQSQETALSGLKESLEAMERTVSHYEDRIPGGRALVTFQGQITELMTANGLTDQVIVPQGEVEANGLNCIPVRMNCKGSLDGVFRFCSELQAMDRLVRIENLRLKNDSAYTGQVSLEAETVVFYRSEKAQARQDQTEATVLTGGRDDA